MYAQYVFAAILLFPSLALAKYEVNWSICESDTQCRQCVERGTLSIERADSKVIVSGRSPLGEPVTSELSQYNFKAAETWACDSGRMRVLNDSGSVKVSYAGRPVVLNGKQFEFCSVQTK